MLTASSKRTLLFYVHSLAGGGAERVIARLASGFAARLDRVLLVVEREAEEWRSDVDDRVELIVLPQGRLRSIMALAELLARAAPDVSVSALAATNFKHVLAAFFAGRLKRAVISYHGFADSEPQLLGRLGYRAMPLLSRLSAAVITVSSALERDLITRFFAARHALTTIYNPAPPEVPQLPLAAPALSAREPLVLAMGRLVADKGPMLLLRAFARVKHPRARLAILGKGPLLAALQLEAERLGVADRVELPGFVSNPGAYLSRARCFVSPSYHESFGLVIVEALDHGLPVVATDSGGPREILDSPELGRLVPVADEEALAEAIDATLAAPGDPAPRQRRAAQFDLDTAIDRHDALFRRVAASAARPGWREHLVAPFRN